jgi:Domain of unknown function (DUF3578).
VGFIDDLVQVSQLPYDPKSPARRGQDIFSVLERLSATIRSWCPRGYRVLVSKGVGNLPEALWIAVLREDVTTTPTAGLYVVFLFHRNRQSVSLSLNQGVTDAGRRAKTLVPRISSTGLLRAEAYSIFEVLPDSDSISFSRSIELGSGRLANSYAAGNIAAQTWTISASLQESDIRASLEAMLSLYDAAVEAKEQYLLLEPGRFQLRAREPRTRDNSAPIFAPKSSDDYVVAAKSYVEPQVRTRVHEALVLEFGTLAASHGFTPATNRHPIDLTLEKGGRETLVEVKVLDPSHPAGGIRESIGQLYEYRKFLRPNSSHVGLMVLYNVQPAGAHLELLNDLHISVAWREGGGFDGPGTRFVVNSGGS